MKKAFLLIICIGMIAFTKAETVAIWKNLDLSQIRIVGGSAGGFIYIPSSVIPTTNNMSTLTADPSLYMTDWTDSQKYLICNIQSKEMLAILLAAKSNSSTITILSIHQNTSSCKSLFNVGNVCWEIGSVQQ
jgi:hypothetical protein